MKRDKDSNNPKKTEQSSSIEDGEVIDEKMEKSKTEAVEEKENTETAKTVACPPPLVFGAGKQPNMKEDLPKPDPMEEQFHAFKGKPALSATFDALLKSPGTILYELQEGDRKTVSINLLLTTIGCLAVFGGLLDSFRAECRLGPHL